MITGRAVWGQEESKCHTYQWEGREEVCRKLQASQSHLISWEDDRATNPGKLFQTHAKQESHDGLLKGKSYLTNLINFYSEMTSLENEGRTVDIVYLELIKALDTISHNNLIEKMMKCGLGE